MMALQQAWQVLKEGEPAGGGHDERQTRLPIDPRTKGGKDISGGLKFPKWKRPKPIPAGPDTRQTTLNEVPAREEE